MTRTGQSGKTELRQKVWRSLAQVGMAANEFKLLGLYSEETTPKLEQGAGCSLCLH